jgi:uncharacterized protein (DUF427 family)
MNAKPVRQPGPDHPISIAPISRRVIVTVAGRTVADTREALVLREANYPPVTYIPRQDVDMSMLTRSELTSYCPYKGDCAYYSIPAGGEKSTNAVWTYETPFPAVGQISKFLAFYPSRVDTISES